MVFLLVVLALTAVRVALPGIVRYYVQQTLDRSPDYTGDVGDIDIHLWRGAYTIHDLKIVKRRHAVPIPFFESPNVDLSIDGHWLIRTVQHGWRSADVYFRDGRKESGPWTTLASGKDALYDVVDVLVEVAEGRGASPAQIALAWLLGRPGVTSVIVGARTDAQLADNLAAAELELSAEERARLDEVSAPPLIYPYWHQARTANDRLSDADLALLAPYV